MTGCALCPRRCGARRFVEPPQRGFCGAGATPRVFRWGLHRGEEPPITGERGSGCIFFSHCTMRCIYCQNSPWSREGRGDDIDTEGLKDIMRRLALEDRAENWNLVSPTPHLPSIREAAHALAAEGVRLPFVWNSSGYERTETLEEYAELCDIALFDLRYSRDATAAEASATPDYVAAARDAVRWAWNKGGERGLIVRLLVLPGHADEAVENLEWLASEVSNEVPVSIMSQYTPQYLALTRPPYDRPATEEEYALATEAAADMGFCNGWTQGFGSRDPGLALQGVNMAPGRGEVS